MLKVNVNILLLLHDGFEEIEAIVPIDMLRRAHSKVLVASLTDKMAVTGAHEMHLRADCLFSSINDYNDFNCLILPGGPGVFKLLNREDLLCCLKIFDQAKKWIAAICAAPLLLKRAQILPEQLTAHFSVSSELPACRFEPVVISRHFITANGPGAVFPFTFAILESLYSKELVFSLKKDISYQ